MLIERPARACPADHHEDVAMALYAFDGTWNSAVVDDDYESVDDTNVVRFYEAYVGSKWYVSGPGTRLGRLGRKVGGLTGAGARDRVEEAYKELARAFGEGDTTIDIVGFSRGAAIALDFANLIKDKGVRDPETDSVLAADAPIRFVGLWDVVGSFGIPIGERVFQRLNVGHKLRVPKNVEYAYHALALDERRQSFRPTRQLNAYEVWFRGVHSDVGGGNGNVGLSTIALRWMLRKAAAAGLPIAPEKLAACDVLINCDAALVHPKDPITNAYREFWDKDRVHYTVADRHGHHNAPPLCGRETEVDEVAVLTCAMLPQRRPPERKASPLDVIDSFYVGSDD
jgi:uncharacterized protein (DUF2235 family)